MEEIKNQNKNEIEACELHEDVEAYEDDRQQVYPIKEISIEKSTLTISELKRKLDFLKKPETNNRCNIKIDPDFQRKFCWTKDQQSKLIESILMRIPLPVFYFFESDNGMKEVIDGRQRITSIYTFVCDKLKLDNLKILTQFNGKAFSELEAQYQNKIEDFCLDIYTINKGTPEAIKYDIFERLNTGGTKLSKQEIRNATCIGTSTELLQKLSRLDSFKNATKTTLKKEKDKDMILRFISFYFFFTNFFDEELKYNGSLDDFLVACMKLINKKKFEEFDEFIKKFDTVMKNIATTCENAFRFEAKETNNTRPINMALFESVANLFFKAFENNIQIDIFKFSELKKAIDLPKYFTYSIYSLENVKFRFNAFQRLLEPNFDIEKFKEELNNDSKN